MKKVKKFKIFGHYAFVEAVSPIMMVLMLSGTEHQIPGVISICCLTFCTSQAYYGMLWEIHRGTGHQILTIKSTNVGFLTVSLP